MNFEQSNNLAHESGEEVEKKSIVEKLRRSSVKLKMLAAMLLIGNTVAHGEMQGTNSGGSNETTVASQNSGISAEEYARQEKELQEAMKEAEEFEQEAASIFRVVDGVSSASSNLNNQAKDESKKIVEQAEKEAAERGAQAEKVSQQIDQKIKEIQDLNSKLDQMWGR